MKWIFNLHGAFVLAVSLLVGGQGTSLAQSSSWASDAPVVHGHHHCNITGRGAHERFWGDALGGVPTPWREVQIFKSPNALVFLADRAPSGGTLTSASRWL